MQEHTTTPLAADHDSPTPLTKLLGLFALEHIKTDQYVGQSLDLGFRNLFGGHILGQALVAAGNTCDARSAHSLHAYFIRGGNPHAPIDYTVDRIRDGNSFSVRRVTASQGGQAILILSSSFQVDEQGFEHQFVMPDVPPPESLTPIFTSDLAIDIRPVDPVDRYQPRKKDPVQNIWFRANGGVPNNPALQKCLLAYASDFSLLSTCLRPHGLTYHQPNMVTASLDHAMWFYRDFRVDDWLLYACDSPTSGNARGLNRGNIFSRDGKLVASVTQEGLIRQLVSDRQPAA